MGKTKREFELEVEIGRVWDLLWAASAFVGVMILRQPEKLIEISESEFAQFDPTNVHSHFDEDSRVYTFTYEENS